MTDRLGQHAPPTEEKPKMLFRLYILGGSPHAKQALANFQDIANQHLAGRYELEVVDVGAEPLRALNDGVLVTPTLIRLSDPLRRIMGDLSETDLVLAALELPEPRFPGGTAG